MLSVLFRLLLNVLRIPLVLVRFIARLWRKPPEVVHFRLHAALELFSTPEPFWRRWVSFAQPTFTSIASLWRWTDRIQERGQKPRIALVEWPSLAVGWASAWELRELLLTWKKLGIEVWVYFPETAGNKDVYVASAASKIVAHPAATLAVNGVSAELWSVKDLMSRLGLAVEVYRRADYKSAGEMFSESHPSAAQLEQTRALLQGIEDAFEAALLSRSGDAGKVAEWLKGAVFAADAAKEIGVIDEVAYRDQLPKRMSVEPDHIVDGLDHLDALLARMFLPLRRAKYVAVAAVRGTIGMDQTGLGPPEERLLREVREDDRAVAVVLYVNSPGGSAFVSDELHHAVALLREKKPVFAIYGDVSASGGYYLSAAVPLHATPLTITGSIGVIAMRPVLEGLSRWGVRSHTEKTAPYSDLLTTSRAFAPDERELFDAHIAAMYQRFVQIVSDGRKIELERAESLARGRVYLGTQAEANGLLDKIGGFQGLREAMHEYQGYEMIAVPPPRVPSAPWIFDTKDAKPKPTSLLWMIAELPRLH